MGQIGIQQFARAIGPLFTFGTKRTLCFWAFGLVLCIGRVTTLAITAQIEHHVQLLNLIKAKIQRLETLEFYVTFVGTQLLDENLNVLRIQVEWKLFVRVYLNRISGRVARLRARPAPIARRSQIHLY
ncbi:hypothetical protein BpHYR1_012445 [Brachionus plicatilis]|uniref:Uncharacterized protein n=1 Tax=Brachionus plicatilis TaxID=10195 RepID=A0A3M7P3L2_BRAPC|nr:hypothetical protein BpHYR1_012445 [Brachionus plicatilis]